MKLKKSFQSSSRERDAFKQTNLLSQIRKEFGKKNKPNYKSTHLNTTKNRRMTNIDKFYS